MSVCHVQIAYMTLNTALYTKILGETHIYPQPKLYYDIYATFIKYKMSLNSPLLVNWCV